MAGSVSGLHIFGPDTGPESLSLLDGNYTSLTNALNTLANFSNSYHDGGAVNAIAVTVPSPQIFAYVDGLVLEVLIAATNTGAVTLNVNGLGAKGCTEADGTAFVAGRLLSGFWARFLYDGAAGQFRLIGGGAQGQLNSLTLAGTLTVLTGGSSIKGTLTIPAPASGGIALAIGGGAGITMGGQSNPGWSNAAAGGWIQGFNSGQLFYGGGTGQTVILSSNGYFDGSVWRYMISAVTSQVAASNLGFTVQTAASGTAGNSFTQVTQFQVGIANGQAQCTDDGGTLQFVGFRGMPINTQAGNYTTVLSDRGKDINDTGAGSTITIPANVYTAGDVVAISTGFVTGVLTIAQGASFTLFWANGTGNVSGNRTLNAIGQCVILFTSATTGNITGSGLS